MKKGTVVVSLSCAAILAVYLGSYFLVRAMNYRELPRKPTFDSPSFYPATVIAVNNVAMRSIYILFYPAGWCEWFLTGRYYLLESQTL